MELTIYPMRQSRKLFLASFMVLLIIATPFLLIGQPIPPSPSHADLVRSTDSLYQILFIGQINSDCYEDTVIAVVGNEEKINWRKENILPRYILWGKRRGLLQPNCQDTAGGIIADSAKYSYSFLHYPSFIGLRGSLSYVLLNNDDTLYDILCFLWGKTDTSTTSRDTSTTFAVFGKKGMDTLRILPLHTIDTTQHTPLRAVQLKRPKNFNQSGRRDFSGRKSYYIPSVALVVVVDTNGHHDSVVIQEMVAGLSPENTLLPAFKVYPNPAVNLTTIVGQHLTRGTYTIELLQETGESVWRKEVVSLSGEDIVFSMDVSSLTTGYYHLSVRTSKGLVGTFPILIIH